MRTSDAIRLAAGVAAFGAVGFGSGLMLPKGALADLIVGGPGSPGATFGLYSYRDPSCTQETDPIDVVFLGDWPTVQTHAAHHGGWDTHETNVQYFWDHGRCVPNQADAASNSASLLLQQRFHMRLRTASTNADGTAYDVDPYWGIWTGATAHHEQKVNLGNCPIQGAHAIDDQTVSGGSGIFYYEGGYNRARADILNNWTTLGIGNHLAEPDELGTLNENWGNTDPMLQCNNNVAWSSGDVYFIEANSQPTPTPPPGPTPIPPPPPCTGKC